MSTDVDFIPDFELDDELFPDMDELASEVLSHPHLASWRGNEKDMRCIIVDIDGTLADVDHRLHHILGMTPDWEGFFSEMYKDVPHEEVMRLVQIYFQTGYIVYLISARPEEYRIITETWLEKYSIPYDFLFMRDSGDRRADDVVKQEILDKEFPDLSLVEFVLEDRPQLVEMYRENGLRVLAVNSHPESDYKTRHAQ